MKTANLTGALLDYWTARAEGVPAEQLEIRTVPRTTDTICVKVASPENWCKGPPITRYDPSTNWAAGGPLIDKHRLDMTSLIDPVRYQIEMLVLPPDDSAWYWVVMEGDTPLQAICRAVVRAAFGDEVGDFPC